MKPVNPRHIHKCQRCGAKFVRRPNGTEYKYCSLACNARRVNIDFKALKIYAAVGMPLRDITVRLGLAPTSTTHMRRWMRVRGWYSVWQKARFKKCQEAV